MGRIFQHSSQVALHYHYGLSGIDYKALRHQVRNFGRMENPFKEIKQIILNLTENDDPVLHKATVDK